MCPLTIWLHEPTGCQQQTPSNQLTKTLQSHNIFVDLSLWGEQDCSLSTVTFMNAINEARRCIVDKSSPEVARYPMCQQIAATSPARAATMATHELMSTV